MKTPCLDILLAKIVGLKYSSYSLQESNPPWHDLGEGSFFGKASFSESQKGVSVELVELSCSCFRKRVSGTFVIIVKAENNRLANS